MKRYELYLDESGEFGINDKNKELNPSLIGGILVLNGLNDEFAYKNILNGEKSHISTDRNKVKTPEEKKSISKKQLEILEKINNLGYEFVIFENIERKIMNSPNELYLSMMADGIANLMERLCIENPNEPISLTVKAAFKRIDPKKEFKNATEATIQLDEYEPIIIKKVKSKILQQEYYVTPDSNISFNLDSANLSYSLMLCDAVCNAYLTQDAFHFTSEQKNKLKNLFKNSKYIFKINREKYEIMLSKYLSHNKIVDSIFLAFEQTDKEKRKFITDLIAKNLDSMPLTQVQIQNDLLKMKIEEFLKIRGDMKYAEEFVTMVYNDICIKLKSDKFEIKKMKLDILLYILTVYTHEGKNLESEKVIQKCEEKIKFLKGDIAFFEYYNILKNRKSVFYIDCLAYSKSVDELSDLIKKNRDIKETLKNITGDEDIKSNLLGKSLGTRLQAYTNMIRSQETQEKKEKIYEFAKKDWEEAVNCYSSKEDISREYIYRSNLECEMEKYEDALLYLYKSIFNDSKVTSSNVINNVKVLLNEILKSKPNIYFLNQLIKIMGESSKNNFGFAKNIFDVIDKSRVAKAIILGNQIADISINSTDLFDESKHIEITNQHPFELIYNYYGIYFANSKNIRLSKEFFRSAIQVANKTGSMTLEIYKIVVYANMYIYFKERCYLEDLIKCSNILFEKYYVTKNDMEYPSNKIIEDIKDFCNLIQDDQNSEEDIIFGANDLINLLRI